MKRFVSLVLTLCLLSALNVSGADPFRADMSAPAEVVAGENFEISFSFSGIPAGGLCGIDLELSFDSSLVSFVSASISGFPEEGDWCGAGRVSGSKYLYHIFDQNTDENGAYSPVALTSGEGVSLTLTFVGKLGSEGDAIFSLSGRGAVMGTVVSGDNSTSIFGDGNSATVRIIKSVAPDSVGEGWYIKDGVMVVRPGITAEDLAEAGVLIDGNGTAKTGCALLGDSFEHVLYAPMPVEIGMDVNGDGYFTSTDRMLILLHLEGGKLLSGKALDRADGDRDGVITASDALVFKLALMDVSYPF